MYKIKEDILYSLEETVGCLKESLEKAYLSREVGVHLIKAQTSIGKTTQYIDLVARHLESKFIIALPTNILKQQVKNDLLLKGILDKDIFVTLSLAESIFLRNEWEQIENAYKSGIYNKKNIVLKELLKKIEKDPNKKAMKEEMQ